MIKLSKAIEGYFIHAEARQLSEHTLKDYRNTLEHFLKFRRDVRVDQIMRTDVEQFLASFNGVSRKTKLNYHTGLSALWTWLVSEELVEEHVVRQIKPPKPEEPVIVPLSEQDVKLLLASVEYSRP